MEIPRPTIDWRFKGWPDLSLPRDEVARAALGVEDLEPPVMLLHERALAHNVETMARWCAQHDVDLAPHGKTTMAPAIFRRQLEAGARAITVATVAQARVCRKLGVASILIANEVTDPSAAAWIRAELDAHPDVGIACFVDSEHGLATLARVRGRRPVDVLIEVGCAGGRCGVRDRGALRGLAAAIVASDAVRLVGVAGYEGLLARDRDASGVAAVDEFLASVGQAALDCRAFFEIDHPVLSAGGSAYFDRVVEVLGQPAAAVDGRVLLRSGCYVSHDHGLYERTTPAAHDASAAPVFRPALTLLARVLSHPEHSRIVVGAGKRDVAFDVEPPIPLAPDGRPDPALTVVRLDDQHIHIQLRATSWREPGDLLSLGISHPCAAFDRWRLLPLVDDDGRVLDAIETYF